MKNIFVLLAITKNCCMTTQANLNTCGCFMITYHRILTLKLIGQD